MTRGSPRLKELDALRGLAAMMVVLFHLTRRYFETFGKPEGALPGFPIEGMQGVFCFFVLSGFVISMSLERTKNGREFAVARFSRIYPAYWAAIVLTFCIVWALGLPEREVSVSVALINLTMLEAYLGVDFVDVVYWSLEAELAFYLAAYLLHARGWLGKHPLRVAWVWLAYCAAWELLRRFAGVEPPNLVFWLTLVDFAPLFVAGIVFFRMYKGEVSFQSHAVVAASFLVHNTIHWQGSLNFLVTCATYASFYLLTFGKLGGLAVGPLIWLGQISYPLYLIHNNAGMAMIRRLTSLGMSYNLALFVTIGVLLLLSALVYRYVEKPAMRWLRSHLMPRREPRSSEGAPTAPTVP